MERGIFEAGVSAHAILQFAVVWRPEDDAALNALIDKVTYELVTVGRSFDGGPKEILNVESAIAGANIAREYILFNGLPGPGRVEIGLAMDADGNACPYDSPKARFKAIVDWIGNETLGDEDWSGEVVTARDYKSAWPTNAEDLNTLQRQGQAVLAWLHYGKDVDGVSREVVNLRTGMSYSEVTWFNPEGLEQLQRWKENILLLCNAADANREANPGIGCFGCPWVLTCHYADQTARESDDLALSYTVAAAQQQQRSERLRKATKQHPIEVPGGYVGYQVKEGVKAKDDVHKRLLWRWMEKSGESYPDAEACAASLSVQSSMLAALPAGITQIRYMAKTLYPDDKDEQAAFVDEMTEVRNSTTFKAFKK
jgi:hypothetical protein